MKGSSFMRATQILSWLCDFSGNCWKNLWSRPKCFRNNYIDFSYKKSRLSYETL